MPVITTDMEVAAARIRTVPLRYRHFRQSVWQNYTDVGSRALACGETDLAHRMFSEALIEARKEYSLDYRLAVSFAHVGHSLLSQGNFSQAANTYLRALSIARNVGNIPKTFEIMLLEILGDIRLSQGQLRLAKRHFIRAISLREEFVSGELEPLAKALLKLASVFSKMGDTDQAIALYEKSKALR